ncbi:MAG: hypothetical protein ACOY5Y_19075 [Pseudomonadota bacterium]|uniref:hypothetical protein n=1 Tax=unclassified Phenylobacterium TaxID=2640670 RepID=UPI0011F657D4|nr:MULTISPECIES: hypothetical protein [unclassified Phenylobacterium]TAJ69368.1 MAG: hypothetical protein EPO51_22935 [Phenylobacterium sp.]
MSFFFVHEGGAHSGGHRDSEDRRNSERETRSAKLGSFGSKCARKAGIKIERFPLMGMFALSSGAFGDQHPGKGRSTLLEENSVFRVDVLSGGIRVMMLPIASDHERIHLVEG